MDNNTSGSKHFEKHIKSMNQTMGVINPTDDLFYVCYEPKVKNRFIVFIKDETGKEIIPAYLLKSVDRPSVTRYTDGPTGEHGPWRWNQIKLSAYDPISPSGSKLFMDYVKNPRPFEMIIRVLGPVGDCVEEWIIVNAKIIHVDFGDLAWNNDGDPSVINAVVAYDFATLTI